MTVRKIEKGDTAALLEMSSELWPEFGKNDLARGIDEVFASPREEGLVCVGQDGTILGFAFVSIRSDYVEGAKTKKVGYLEAIFVKKHFRKMNAGATLVEAAEEWCLAKGCTEIGSDTDTNNSVSQTFHLNVGFKEAGRNVHFLKSLE